MSDPRRPASLTPTLLARKGAAKPAMRPQLQPMHEFHEKVARDMGDDLGWNDLGEDHVETRAPAEVVPLNAPGPCAAAVPEVVRQQEAIVHSIARAPTGRKSALAQGRRAAFTLRLDAERHLKLRLACTISDQSAQQLVTEALDRLLADMPDVAALASRVRKRG